MYEGTCAPLQLTPACTNTPFPRERYALSFLSQYLVCLRREAVMFGRQLPFFIAGVVQVGGPRHAVRHPLQRPSGDSCVLLCSVQARRVRTWSMPGAATLLVSSLQLCMRL